MASDPAEWLLLAAWTWPLLLALAHAPASRPPAPGTARRPWRDPLTAAGAAPALLAALALPDGATLELPWLLLGTSLALDATGRVFLLFTALLWLAAGVYAAAGSRSDERGGRFHALFLLAMAGNLWLIVGADLISFYAGFAMMGLAAYGLVIHDGSPSALRAGRIYLVMALLGEVSLFAGLVMVAHQTGTLVPQPQDLTGLSAASILLILLGLGVKAGLVPLHLWLPLAHPAAPIPASAVLSGAMIKVALLGWLRFLPVGATALPDWGALLAAGGVLTTFYALPLGLVQSDPKVVLAYSSVSKMGLLMLILGLILMQPALAPVGVAALAAYAGHHSLVKGGLFLGIGLRKQAALQPLVLGGMLLLALAMAAAPFTSGAVAKYGLKPVLEQAAWPWVPAAVTLAAAGTTLLMARLLWITVRTPVHPQPGMGWPALAWTALLALVAAAPFALGTPAGWDTDVLPFSLAALFAAAIALAAWRNPGWLRPVIGLVLPGDLAVLLAPIGRTTGRAWAELRDPVQARSAQLGAGLGGWIEQRLAPDASDAERGLRAWPVAGGLWILVTGLLLLATIWGSVLVGGDQAGGPAATGPAEPEAAAPADATTAPRGTREPRAKPASDAALPGTAAPADAPAPAIGAQAPAPRETPASTTGEAIEPEPSPLAPEPTETIPKTDAAEADAIAPVSPRDEVVIAARAADAAHERARDEGVPQDGAGAEPAARAASESRPESARPDAPEPPASIEPLEDPGPGHRGSGAETAEAVPAAHGVATAAPVCDPPVPYRFERPDGDPLLLAQCDRTEDPPARKAAPALTNELVRAVQQRLAALGYDPGPVDGLIGPRTRAAVRALQRDAARDADGVITFELLDRLQPPAP